MVDVKDKANPKLIIHKAWAPPFGGGTHNALPLPDRNLLIVVDETVLDNQEDGFKPIWVFDNQVKSNPISISTFPAPSDKDYLKVGGHFGPHNVHENRPGSFQSSELIFATYQNAGAARVRHQRPVPAEGGRRPSCRRAAGEAGSTRARTAASCCTPPTSSSTRTRSATSTDFSAGLYIVEYTRCVGLELQAAKRRAHADLNWRKRDRASASLCRP